MIDKIAKKTGFVQRKSKLKPLDFLKSLLFSYQQGKELSLLDICADLFNQGIEITKQSLDQRFNDQAVHFLKSVLATVLESQFESDFNCKNSFSPFNRVRVKDSTRFALPAAYKDKFKGHGGCLPNSAAMISIQYEYDLLSSQTLDFGSTINMHTGSTKILEKH